MAERGTCKSNGQQLQEWHGDRLRSLCHGQYFGLPCCAVPAALVPGPVTLVAGIHFEVERIGLGPMVVEEKRRTAPVNHHLKSLRTPDFRNTRSDGAPAYAMEMRCPRKAFPHCST